MLEECLQQRTSMLGKDHPSTRSTKKKLQSLQDALNVTVEDLAQVQNKLHFTD